MISIEFITLLNWSRLSFEHLEPVPQYLLTLGRSSDVQMCSRSEGAMRLH